MDRDGALLGTLRELLEQLLPPNEPHEDAPPVDEPREEEDAPSPADEPPPADELSPASEPREGENASDADTDTDSVPDLASASSSSDSDEGPPPARRRPRMPALAPASSSDSESDGDAPELASASSSDDEAEAPPPRRAAAGPRVVRVGRHVLVVGGGPGEGRPDLGDRPARVRTALALIRHVMLASRGSDTHEDMADTLARDGAARSPHVVAAFRAVDRAQFLPADARADAYIDSPARSGAFHQSSPSIYAAALEALDLGGARRRSFLNIGSGTGYFSALCAAAAAAAGGELSPHVGVERHAELVDWARTRTTADPAARIRAELVAFSSSSLADHLADIAPYAAARGASSLAELAALPADTLDDMIASAGWSILKAATFRRHLARYHDEHAGRTWLPPHAPDVFYDVGDVFDVVEALRDAHSPLRGRFDRVYVGAGVDRSSCRTLLRLLAPDGLLVAPRDDRHGEAQRLVTAVRRGAGDAYAITAGARVAFASLVRPSGGGVASRAPALAGPVWGEARPGAFPPAFRAAAATLARGVARGGGGASSVPWHVWRAKILPFVPAHWFERARGDDGGPRACAQCGLPAHARCSCGLVTFCSRDCQRAGFDAHAAACSARPVAGNDTGDASDDGDELGALSRRLRAAVRAAEAAVAGEEAGPAPDDNRAEARARRARYHSWWWDDDGAADDENDGVGATAEEDDEDDGASAASSDDEGG